MATLSELDTCVNGNTVLDGRVLPMTGACDAAQARAERNNVGRDAGAIGHWLVAPRHRIPSSLLGHSQSSQRLLHNAITLCLMCFDGLYTLHPMPA